MYRGYKGFTYVQYIYVWPSPSQRLVMGDASETALLKFTELTIGNILDYRNRFNKVVEVPFNSTNKFQVRNMLTQHALNPHVLILYNLHVLILYNIHVLILI